MLNSSHESQTEPDDQSMPGLQSEINHWMMVLIGPVLIMVLAASLLFFMVEVFYRDVYSFRLCYIFALFVCAAVLVSRISIDRGRSYAVLYAAPLGLATVFVGSRFAEIQGPLGIISPLIFAIFLGIIWWFIDKLTWDCTVVDISQDVSKQGLVKTVSARLQGRDENEAEVEAPDSTATVTAAIVEQPSPRTSSQAQPQPSASRPSQPWGSAPTASIPGQTRLESASHLDDANDSAANSLAPNAAIDWWQRLPFNRKRKNAPGVWVLYSAIGALPIFGLGQAFVPAADVSSRRYVFILFAAYMFASLALLVSTSLTSLQRYLHTRSINMPNQIAINWLAIGGLGIGAILFLVWLFPRPAPEVSLLPKSLQLASNKNLKPSRFGWGNESNQQSETGKQGKSSQQQASGNKQGQGKTGGNQRQKSSQSNQQNSDSSRSESSGNRQTQSSNSSDSSGGSQRSSGQQGSKSNSSENSRNSNGESGGENGSSGNRSDSNRNSSNQSSSSQNRNGNESQSSGGGSESGSGNSNSNQSQNDPSGSKNSDQDSNQNNSARNEQQSQTNQTNGNRNSPRDNRSDSNQDSRDQNQNDDQERDRQSQSQNSSDNNSSGRGSSGSSDPEQQDGSQSNSSGGKQNSRQENSGGGAGPKPSGNQSANSFNLSGITGILGGLIRFVFIVVLLLAIAAAIWFFRKQIKAGLEKLVQDLKELLQKLFGFDFPEPTPEEIPDEVTPERIRTFRDFADPFENGAWKSWSSKQLFAHTFAAFEAWGNDCQVPRELDQTPREYARTVKKYDQKVGAVASKVAESYSELAYAPPTASSVKPELLRQFWKLLRDRHSFGNGAFSN